MKKRLASLFGMALCGGVLAFSGPVYSTPGQVAPTYTFTAATSGQEVGYFYGSTAGDTDLLGVWDNGVQLGSWALSNHASSFGASYDFGHVNAGDTIVFALYDTTLNDTVYSDPAMNADGINHTYTTAFSSVTKKGVTIPDGTFVGFEDLLLSQHSDLNYNDEDVVFSDLAATAGADPTATPEPSSLLLLGMGLAGTGIGLARRKRS